MMILMKFLYKDLLFSCNKINNLYEIIQWVLLKYLFSLINFSKVYIHLFFYLKKIINYNIIKKEK